MSNLARLRDRIDAIDEAIVSLLNERVHLAEEIGSLKNETHKRVLDSQRENQVILHVEAMTRHPVLKRRIPDLYKMIMEISREVQAEFIPLSKRNLSLKSS